MYIGSLDLKHSCHTNSVGEGDIFTVFTDQKSTEEELSCPTPTLLHPQKNTDQSEKTEMQRFPLELSIFMAEMLCPLDGGSPPPHRHTHHCHQP